MELDLKGKLAIVTGASQGLGRAIARELAREGMKLVLVARNAEALREAAAECLALGSPMQKVKSLDLSDKATAAEAIGLAAATGEPIELLVNCVGATKRGDFLELTDADWTAGYDLKFFGTVRMCRAAWPELVKSRGSIVNIVGVGSRTPSADFTIGGSVNSALLNLTKALADRGRSDGVRVNAVNPGYIMSERLERRIDSLIETTARSRGEVEADLLNMYAIRRFGRPDEVGTLVAYLASRQGAYFHGALIDLDGGATKGL